MPVMDVKGVFQAVEVGTPSDVTNLSLSQQGALVSKSLLPVLASC